MPDVLVFDFETAGGDTQEICQIGWLLGRGNAPVTTGSMYLQISGDIDPRAQAVHGLSKDFLQANGRPAKEGLALFSGIVHQHILEGGFLVGHGLVSFDLPVLERNLDRLQLPHGALKQAKVYDTGLAYKARKLDEMGQATGSPFDSDWNFLKQVGGRMVKGLYWKLDLLVKEYGIEEVERAAHDACEDCRLCWKILLAQAARGELLNWDIKEAFACPATV